MILKGKAVVIRGDNIDTDVLYPGEFLNIDDPEKMKPHLFKGLDPTILDKLQGETILVVDDNFGSGSSREHVPLAIRANGVTCVLGKSFARIFYRNCFNLGVPAVMCPAASEAAKPGAQITIDTDTGKVTVDGQEFDSTPIPRFMLDMLESGGLVEWGQRRLAGAGA
jgi:3-isopropylmalate/(R)-2-methylmalate dehydratase small subunit